MPDDDLATLSDLLAHQRGVVSRPQALARGLREHDLRRLQRRRLLSVVIPGVYVDHTGEPAWEQHAWAATLLAAPAALCGTSALLAAGATRRPPAASDLPIEVAVAVGRRVADRPQLRVQRYTHLEKRTLWNASPPRLRVEEAALDVAARASDELAALAVLTEACQARRTTGRRLLDALTARERMPSRAWLEAVLRDVADGTCSVLEHGYLTRVQRPHGLPLGRRQVREVTDAGRVVYRDLEHGGDLVELDGRLFHGTREAWDADHARDLAAAAAGRSTVRLTYGQVFGDPCRTAGQLAVVFRRSGWPAEVRRCGPDCPIEPGSRDASWRIAATG